jgi:hypothetical protein
VIRMAFLLLTIATSVVAQKCDLAPGDLDLFISSNRVLVTNVANTKASVTVTVGDKTQSATLESGGKLSVRSFRGGEWRVAIFAAASKREYFQAQISILSTYVNKAGDISNDEAQSVQDQIERLEKQLESIPEDAIPGGKVCKGRFSEKGASELEILVNQDDNGDWECT